MSVEEQTTEAEPPQAQERELVDKDVVAASPAPPRVVVPRWVQLVVLPLALLALWALARAAGKVFVIFVVAALIALILNPAVAFLQRSRLPRGLAVLAVYVAFFLTLAGIGFLLANPIFHQVQSFIHNLPKLVDEANETLASVESWLNRHGIHVQIQKAGQNGAADDPGRNSPRAPARSPPSAVG